MKISRFFTIVFLFVLLRSAQGQTTSITNGQVDLSVNPISQSYQISWRGHSGWTFAGTVGFPFASSENEGDDTLGHYQEIILEYNAHGIARASGLRLYSNFLGAMAWTKYPVGSPNRDPFPVFNSFPDSPTMNHLAYSAGWGHTFGDLGKISPYGDSPWVFFDAQNAAIISSGNDPFNGWLQYTDGQQPTISLSVKPAISNFSRDYTQQTIISFGSGVNRAFDNFGASVIGLSGKPRPSNTQSPLLDKLSYWTDNGTTEYYNGNLSDGALGVLQDILLALKEQGTPAATLELDSWWYPKDPGDNGALQYMADPKLFQFAPTDSQHLANSNLQYLVNSLGVDVVLHMRYLSSSSPYRVWKPTDAPPSFQSVSGNIPFAPELWDNIFDGFTPDMSTARNVAGVEQDWMFQGAAPDDSDLDGWSKFLGNMSASALAKGKYIIYCMPLLPHYQAAAYYPNVLAIRDSNDTNIPEYFAQMITNSRLAKTFQVWPFNDAGDAIHTDRMLLLTLAGPVGIGNSADDIRKNPLVAKNLKQAILPNGRIVGSDQPLIPMEQYYRDQSVMVASTYSDFGTLRVSYVTAFVPTTDLSVTVAPVPSGVDLAELGYTGPVFVYDYFKKTGRLVESSTYPVTATGDITYLVASPVVDKTGIALIGDESKFATAGKQRIASITSDESSLSVTVNFTPGEPPVTLVGFSEGRPTISAIQGSAALVSYSRTKTFRVRVAPDASGKAIVRIGSKPALYF